MKNGTRLYINITNECNTNCPFCCMYSGTNKQTRMNFNTYMKIIDECEGKFELQLEGGEPLLHQQLYLFIEYAIATGRCDKIIILSNGLILEEHLRRIAMIANWYQILIELKISINYWLMEVREDFLSVMDRIRFATCDMNYVNVLFNVRKRSMGDENMEELLERYGLRASSNVFYLQSYGRLTGSKYEKPVIVQNINEWRIYASDGTCYDKDLIARSEHEKILP